jgi:hypothetical protein
MSHADFYRERAKDARIEADRTPLANVRDRCLRSVEAWEKMADRAESIARDRQVRDAAAGKGDH